MNQQKWKTELLHPRHTNRINYILHHPHLFNKQFWVEHMLFSFFKSNHTHTHIRPNYYLTIFQFAFVCFYFQQFFPTDMTDLHLSNDGTIGVSNFSLQVSHKFIEINSKSTLLHLILQVNLICHASFGQNCLQFKAFFHSMFNFKPKARYSRVHFFFLCSCMCVFDMSSFPRILNFIHVDGKPLITQRLSHHALS